MKTGEKIAKLRKENNYTQEQLAVLLGVSRQSVSKYESGVTYPETDKLIRLSELFGCTVDYLLKDDAEEPEACVTSADFSDKEVFCNNMCTRGGILNIKARSKYLECRYGTSEKMQRACLPSE